MITPYLALVLSGFAMFMLVLGTVWTRGYFGDLRQARRGQGDPAIAPRPTAEAAPSPDRIAA